MYSMSPQMVCVHQMFHGGASVTKGDRYILVGFVAVTDLRNLDRLEWCDDAWPEESGRLDYVVLREHWATMCQEGDSECGDSSTDELDVDERSDSISSGNWNEFECI